MQNYNNNNYNNNNKIENFAFYLCKIIFVCHRRTRKLLIMAFPPPPKKIKGMKGEKSTKK